LAVQGSVSFIYLFFLYLQLHNYADLVLQVNLENSAKNVQMEKVFTAPKLGLLQIV